MSVVINETIPYPYKSLPDYESKYNLKEKHNKTLQILLTFDKYCRELDIKYSLADGTLLGALRHGDFIPWDDDADVMMTKDEYLKFRNSLTPDSPIKLFKISFLDRISIPEMIDEHEMIDLFINEELPASKIVFNWKKFKTAFLRTSFQSKVENFRHRNFSKTKKIAYDTVKIVSGAIARLIIGKRSIFELNERTVDIGNYKSSGMYTRYTSRMYETKRRFNKESYDAGYAEVMFRGYRLMSIKNADTFLREMYGDYMKLLPEEKRVPEHPVDMMEADENSICRYN